MFAVTMTSSALVSAIRRSSPWRTVAGPPMIASLSVCSMPNLLQRCPTVSHLVHGWLKDDRPAALERHELLLERREEPPGLSVGVGGNHTHADHRIGAVERFRRLEARAIQVERRHQLIRREMRGEGKGNAEGGGRVR